MKHNIIDIETTKIFSVEDLDFYIFTCLLYENEAYHLYYGEKVIRNGIVLHTNMGTCLDLFDNPITVVYKSEAILKAKQYHNMLIKRY